MSKPISKILAVISNIETPVNWKHKKHQIFKNGKCHCFLEIMCQFWIPEKRFQKYFSAASKTAIRDDFVSVKTSPLSVRQCQTTSYNLFQKQGAAVKDPASCHPLKMFGALWNLKIEDPELWGNWNPTSSKNEKTDFLLSSETPTECWKRTECCSVVNMSELFSNVSLASNSRWQQHFQKQWHFSISVLDMSFLCYFWYNMGFQKCFCTSFCFTFYTAAHLFVVVCF